MKKPDFSGARGSNAGDDFHELWALRQSLLLLEQNTSLTAVAVEGLVAQDETGELDTWDGVDCTYYFGGENASSSEKVVLEQLKYSASDPKKKWTIARLTYSEAKTKNNSIIRKLANSFLELKKNHPKLVENGNLEIRFVSNQPVNSLVIDTFSKAKTLNKDSKNIPTETNKLIEATSLGIDDFKLFSKALDFSQCGGESRFAIEERVLTTISEWTEDDARTSKNNLLDFIRRKMLPETKGEFITRQSILTQLGFSDPRGLFPCPTAIKSINNLVPRSVTQVIANDMLIGKKRICFHGEGGCGKTTALQELKDILPKGSTFIVYDCYGEGRYLDSDAYRHKSKDAFLQLSNELAQNLRTPLLISPSNNLEYPRVFKKRLEKASEIVSSINKEAFLVIVIDAADNSVTAAKESGEKSFVHEFFNLGALPDNVRFLVTARTGRLDSLNLSPKFERVPIEGFTSSETREYVKSMWKDAPDNWIEDFHFLSSGNPRVQNYALNYAGNEFSKAIDYLRPNGKGLPNVFREQLEHARKKAGIHQDIKYFCAGLVALFRPIPLRHLAEITGLNENHLRDICADLAPGIRLIDNLISFADEEFEHFIRDEANENLPEVRNRIADYFLSRHKSDSYCATHIATALFKANRGQEIIQLISSEKEPSAINDPVSRRETQLQRLKIAMKVCKETDNTTNAILTLLAGASALKTDSAIQEMLINNPDLAANFARDTFGRIILRDSIQIENHGVLLFHLMAFDARRNNGILVREGYRQLRAWLQRRKENYGEQKRKFPNSYPTMWKIEHQDIAAETEAILRISGYQEAITALLSWKPKQIALQVASTLSYNLITSGDENLLEECLNDERVTIPWKLFLLTPLAFTKKKIDTTLLEASLEKLLRLKFINLGKVRESYNEDDFYTGFLEIILNACEIVISRGGNKEVVIPVLEKLSAPEFRQANRLHKSQTALIDLSLRAFTLLENLLGRECVVKTYLISEDENLADDAKKKNKPRSEEKEKLEAFIGKFIRLYNTRAKIILGQISPQSGQEAVEKAVPGTGQEDYRLYNDFYIPKMNRLAALSLTRLMFLPNLNRKSLLESTCNLINSSPFDSTETDIFQRFAIDSSLHEYILKQVISRVNEIKEARTSAEDKIEALVRFARLILPISYNDSESIFNEAITIAGEVNYDSVHEIALFAPLSKSAIRTMEIAKRREIAVNFAVIASDVGIRLNGRDNFPWNKIAETLTNLDFCVASAVVGRWEDDNIVGRTSLLPQILETSLSNKTLSPTQIISLFPLLDYIDEELITKIVNEISKNKDNLDLNGLAEEIAREESLRLGNGKREKVYEKLNSLNLDNKNGFWFDQLFQATVFHKAQSKENIENDDSSNGVGNYETIREDILNSFDWGKYKFVSSEEINAVVKEIFDATKSSDTYIGTYQILEKIRDFIPIGNRVLYLKALSLSESKNIRYYEIAQEITKLTELWEESLSVQDWNRQYILQLIIDKLPSFTRYLSYGDYPHPELPTLLTRSKASDKEICEALLEATQRHVDSLNAPTVYALVGLITQYCQPDEAVEVIEFYSKHLLQQISIEDREKWDLTDIPEKPSEGFARYLYALLGDIDVRNRWRAAHSLRMLARLKDTSTINEIVQLYDRKIEKNYRKPDAPFYWIASRLWLVIALTRIANESPASVKHLSQWLLEIASDADFPHVILRAFAKSAISNLLENKEVSLNSEQLNILKQINISPFPKKKFKKSSHTPFQKYRYKERENRRFSFDSMDTLPYWYSGKARMFENLGLEEFIDVAEQWIVDKWEVKDNPWEWNREPRKDRLSNGYLERTSGHGHGSFPIADRFHTYLEWHAMWCSVGSLLLTTPLVKPEYENDSFEERLKTNGFSSPPYWLVDFRSPKPLDKRFWFAPQKDVDVWIEEVGDNDFLTELQIPDKTEHIVVGSNYDTRSRHFTLSVKVDTALVSSETASSLLKALQTVDNPWDYRIPAFGDDLEIDSPRYKLIGWLSGDYSESGLDERDPFRNEIRAIQCVPSVEVLSALNLEFSFENEPKWIEISSKKEIFSYKSWSDIRWDDYEERRYSNSSVRSDGWRLTIDKNALKSYLNQKDLDLIVEVRIVRKNKDYDYSEYNTKETKEAEFERLFILRRDGTIEAAERCFGTW